MNWDIVADTAFQQKTKKAATTVKRFSKATKYWRSICLQRDGFACVLCQSTDNLEVHHIVRWVDAPALRLKKNNGVTLCNKCHCLYHQSNGSEFPKEITARLVLYVYGKAGIQQCSKKSLAMIQKHLGISPAWLKGNQNCEVCR